MIIDANTSNFENITRLNSIYMARISGIYILLVFFCSCRAEKPFESLCPIGSKDTCDIAIKIIDLRWSEIKYCQDFLCEEAFGVEHMNVYDSSKIAQLNKFVIANMPKSEIAKHDRYFLKFYVYDKKSECGVNENMNWDKDDEWDYDKARIAIYSWHHGSFDDLSLYDYDSCVKTIEKVEGIK